MSKTGLGLPCWAPPIFPEGGRLQLTPEQVNANYKKQIREADDFKNQLSEQAGHRLGFTCSQSLHISLFFDGTGNNEENDTNVARPPHPTNIARLFHATYQDAEDKGYFRYYIPGVGTPFPKINEFDYSLDGLAFAAGGEDRINWALLRLVDALMYAITPTHQRLDDSVARGLLPDMRAHWPVTGEVNRRNAIKRLLTPLKNQVKQARPHLLNIKLFIYGFSRGAAEARTFVNWLTELFAMPPDGGQPDMSLLGLPVSIEFLGLLDTVPSVGIAHIAPGATGHMGWASGTQQLPDETRFPGLIRCCRHFIAAHEQRLSFPLDSVRRPEGSYPANTLEVVYPGMHSDVGGGYPPLDQGKSRGGTGELLSQIVLHDLYLAAFDAGAPLTVSPELITPLIEDIKPSRYMPQDSISEFAISPKLISRFNIWRETLINNAPGHESPPGETGYHPCQLPQVLESAIIGQMGWITAWRIGRYAHNSLLTREFYKHAPQLPDDKVDKNEKEYNRKKEALIRSRKEVDRRQPNWQDQMMPGMPDYEPENSQYQLREAAREFEHDYRNWYRDINGDFIDKSLQILLDVIPKAPVYLLNGDDEKAEYEQMRDSGDYRYIRLFTNRLGAGIRTLPGAELLAFYDDHIHDSRAWFMQKALGGRELWAGYFRYRMIYFGDFANKKLQLISVNGKVVGATSTSDRVEYRVETRREGETFSDVHSVRDLANGQVQTLSPSAMLPADNAPLQMAARQQSQIIATEHQEMLTAAHTHLKASGARII
ncbi:T6SS phospholipase effector Tle1-like catalytic domain-containing protein [Pantoea vagans]|uniref:T6SS phospholipase effector Tle1-like catalytic domain-containing protein n=1 Tax=Pantoea vagans TaxID=470934 RepID=UPI001093AA82|nr:DUF2235 domain-containing protein [Pantoea vagans]QCA06322.1 DUF2235 domain-containing protein [Pantoea vagans]